MAAGCEVLSQLVEREMGVVGSLWKEDLWIFSQLFPLNVGYNDVLMTIYASLMVAFGESLCRGR